MTKFSLSPEFRKKVPEGSTLKHNLNCYAPAVGGIKRYRNPSICPSVCPSHKRAAALGCRHALCLQISRVRTADPSVDGRRFAASRTAIGGGYIVSPPPGR